MSESICLYCEQPLALFQRLSGDVEFCSREHRRLYQKEHERMALDRLLQAARRKPGRPGAKPAPPPEPVEPETKFEEPTVISLGSIAGRVRGGTGATPVKNGVIPPQVAGPNTAAPADNDAFTNDAPPKRAADPVPAGFAPSNGVEPRTTTSVLRDLDSPSAIEWKPAAVQDQPKPGSPAIGVFLTPGSFLPRRIRALAPSAENLAAEPVVQALSFPIPGPDLRVLVVRLRRADRVGFCPA